MGKQEFDHWCHGGVCEDCKLWKMVVTVPLSNEVQLKQIQKYDQVCYTCLALRACKETE